MKLTFQSARLLYQPLTRDDLDLEIALWSDPEVVHFITGEAATVDQIAAQMPIVTQRAGQGAIGIWSLTDIQINQQIGHAALLPLPVTAEDTEFALLQSDAMPDRDIEVGFVLKREFWGSGYATEACRRLIAFAFSQTDLPRLRATTDPGNLASQHVLQKSGMRALGLIPAFAGHYPGFEITRQEWVKAAEGACP